MANRNCLRSNFQILNTGGIPPKCMPGIKVSVVCDKIPTIHGVTSYIQEVYISLSTLQRSQVTKPFQVPGFEVNKLSTYTREYSTAIHIIEKNHTHSMKGFAGYIKLITLQL